MMNKSIPRATIINSDDYHDYLFHDGKFIGEFEQMYQKSKDIPWHQDKDKELLDIKIALNILQTKSPYRNILDIGCGLGYMTSEISKHCKGYESITGVDVSPTAVSKASAMFPHINFKVMDITKDLHTQGWDSKYDLVVVRALFWLTFPYMEMCVNNIVNLMENGGYLLIQQNFPPLPLATNWDGRDIFPNPEALLNYFRPYIIEEWINYLEDKVVRINNDWVFLFGRKKREASS